MDPQDIEHERKFLVADASVIAEIEEGTSIVQGYLRGENGGLRVRWYPTLDTYLFTVKGPRVGITRVEIEWPVERDKGEAVLQACGEWIIEKTRYPVVGPDGKGWDIDVFHGRNDGLMLAELELEDPGDSFGLPPWCGEEVTDDERYYNENLATVPFSAWGRSDGRS